MKDGKETRENGTTIVHNKNGMYYVYEKNGTPSKNGPWDYLCNARRDADDGYPAASSDQNEFMFRGVCIALTVVTARGQDVLWKEIVEAVGREDLIKHATRFGQLEIAGFNRNAETAFGELLNGS